MAKNESVNTCLSGSRRSFRYSLTIFGLRCVNGASELDPFEPTGVKKNSIADFAATGIETGGSSRNEEVLIFFMILSMMKLNSERKINAR